MILCPPDSVAFELFGFAVFWYGIVLAIAVFLGVCVADYLFKITYPKFEEHDIILNLAPWLIFIGFLGARVYYCLVNSSYYSGHFLEVFNVRQGGLSIHGALISCVIFLLFYLKIKNVSFFNVGASLCVGLSFAQAVGRWGNFFNSEAFGKPFDGFLKLYVAPEFRPYVYSDVEFFHPTFLYESVLNLVLFFLLFFIVKKQKISSMFVVGVYLGGYSLIRIFVESLRVDSVLFVLGLPIATFVSIFGLLVATFLILLALKHKFR